MDDLPEVKVKCPDLASIIPGRRKVGGERQIVNVVASTQPYQRSFGKGRKMWCVDVFGYDGKWTVPAKKLSIVAK